MDIESYIKTYSSPTEEFASLSSVSNKPGWLLVSALFFSVLTRERSIHASSAYDHTLIELERPLHAIVVDAPLFWTPSAIELYFL